MLAMAGPADGSRPEIGYFERFGVDPGVIREALQVALASGGGHADLYFQHRITNSYALEDGDVNRAGCGIELGMGVRVLKGDQTGYGFTENLSKEGIVRAARTAAAIARDAARGGPGSLHLSAGGPSRYPMARPWLDVSSADRLKLLNTLNERFFKEDKRIRKVTVQFMDQTCALLLADSAGRLVEDLQPLTSLVVFCVAEQKGRREQVRYRLSGRAGLEFYTPARIDRVVKEAVARTVVLFDAVPAPAGEMPVVLAAGSSGILLHEAIGHGMEADFNRKGISIYADKIGKPVARPFVSIVDDATAPGARGSINVDDEGTVAGRTVLVEDGILTSYLHDLVSARHYKLDPTGNGRRESYRFPPVPRMRSTYMEPGPHKRDEIIASVKRGIYCSTFTNGQVRIGAGDFTFYVQNGCLIENGKLTRPIKDVNIIGNGPEVLQRIDMVADDLLIEEEGWTCGKAGQSVPVSQGLPTVRVGALTVGGRS
ncbi:MAG: TldD/PmbA family protein [Candidatus Riflebacteria bacterium]|nr:TldD/PmbA family protein [Candidatus Riflebacteria bacterium]